jgi:outer membrane lipoprotein-sorting protein
MREIRAVLLAAFLFTCSFSQAQDVHTGEDVLRAMHERYASSWYQTVTFVQKSTTYKEDGTSSAETWYEAAFIPGKLRIDIGPAANGNGYIFSDGNITIVKNNKVQNTRHDVNMLLVLGFDVYRQSPGTTAKVAKDEGYDLSKVHEDIWDGKPAYVVGADKGDLKSKQFWVMKDSLLFVRDVEPSPREPGKVEDIRFIHYQPLAGAGSRLGLRFMRMARKCSPKIISTSRPM